MYSKNTKKVKFEPLNFESYLALIKASVGSKIFQKYYAKVNGKKLEILKNGQLSCAYHVSIILKIFSLVDDIQLTVHRTLDDMQKSGWRKIKKPKIGCVVLWGEKKSSIDAGSKIYAPVHRHIGFYIGNDQVVSTSAKKRAPAINRLHFSSIEALFWNKKLEE